MITVIYADLQETIDVRGSSEQIDVVFVKKKTLVKIQLITHRTWIYPCD
jgi:hypothetical protein